MPSYVSWMALGWRCSAPACPGPGMYGNSPGLKGRHRPHRSGAAVSRLDRPGGIGQRHRRPRLRDGRHHTESILHPNSLACPVAFAFAEAAGGVSGADLLTAIVAGYEVGTRVGNAATMALFLRGFHPQGTSGVFVAAATAGRMLGLGAEPDAACVRHRGFDGGGADGGAGGSDGEAPARRPRGTSRGAGGVARATRIHRHPGCAGGRLRWFPELVFRSSRCRAAHRRPGVDVADPAGRVQAVPQRYQHPYRAGTPSIR